MSAVVLSAAPSAWRQRLPALVLVLLALLLLYRDTVAGMVGIWWRSGTFTHAFVVPPIVGWLIWRQRDALAVLQPRPAPWALLPMALAALAWLAGDLAAANVVTQPAFTALLVLAVPALLGTEVARRLMFPLGFLFFAVPVGEFMVPVLMSWTADFTVAALRLSGIPVYREGQQFVIPSGNWSVVEACSGVRYLMASLTVGVLFAYLNFRSMKRRLLFSLVALLLPVLANWLRAYLIVMLGHLSNNRLAAGADHLIYGWVFFGFVVMLMFGIGSRWSEREAAHETPFASAARGTGAGSASASTAWAVAVAAALLAVWPHAALRVMERGEQPGEPRLGLPALASGWSVADGAPGADWTPAFRDPTAHLQRQVRRGDDVVGLYVGYYRHQDYGRKLVSSDNVLVRTDDPHWTHVERAERVLDAGGRAVAWRAAVLRGSPVAGHTGTERLVVWQAYWIDGAWTTSDVRARAAGAWQRLRGRGDDAAVVIVYALQDERASAEPRIRAFLRDNLEPLERWLTATRDGPP